MGARRIRPLRTAVDADFRAAPSKSVTHRALIAAALARGSSTLHAPLTAADGRVTRAGLDALGLAVADVGEAWVVHGGGGSVPGGARLQLAESGTSMRFLVALAALGATPSTLDGAPRLRERPVQELAGALRRLGGRIELGATPGGLPLTAGGEPLHGGEVRLRADRSSQFASALMLIGSRLPGGLDLILEPPAVSLPYVEVTVRVLADFGVRVERLDELHWRIPETDYAGREYRVEGDHSSASYLFASAAVLGGRVRVNDLRPDSAQPDARLATILQELGCRIACGEDWIEVTADGTIPAFRIEMGDAPDLVPTMAAIALFADGPCEMSGIAHLRHKESDRLEVLARNLRTLGRDARVGPDHLAVGPPPPALRGGRIVTESDHRMAMAFAVAGLRVDGVEIDDPACVAKSNPAFWEQFEKIEG